MAGVTKVNGKYHTEELVHRDLFFKSIQADASGTLDITRAVFEAIMTEVHLTSTIEVIGKATTTEDFNEAAAAKVAADALLAAAVTPDEIAYATQQVAIADAKVAELGAVDTTVNLVISGADVINGVDQTAPKLNANGALAEISDLTGW